ncbi:MAG: class I SAM-dependent methyltransferase, partial [Polyangiales bacterium]
MFHRQGPSLWELIVEGLQSTERGYDMIAPKFDYTPFRTPDWVMEPAIARVGQVDRALDVCCGTGAAMRLLRPHCRREVLGIDFSDGMMHEAGRRIAEDSQGGAGVRFVRGDALEMPFEDAFDVATCFGAFG